MPNQRAIALAAGVTQAAVSKALRGDRSIPEHTRQHIQKIAHSLGYRPNAYVSTLMAHIRSGRPPRDKGCIALVGNEVEKPKGIKESRGGYTFKLQKQGMVDRAEELGFHTEPFNMAAPGISSAHIDKILIARGINGVVFLPPLLYEIDTLNLTWSHYAPVTIAYGLHFDQIDRVSTDHRYNMEISYQKLTERGYQRIGTCLPEEAIAGVNSNWKAAFLLRQDDLPIKQRIPLFVGKPGVTPIEKFRAWLHKWKPDALVCLMGHEKEWFDELGWRLPEDIGMVCVNRPLDSRFCGVEENHEVIGGVVVEVVAAHIQQNEFGFPVHPKLILVKGTWVEGETIRAAKP